MSRRATLILRWTLGGAAFGFCFPLIAVLAASLEPSLESLIALHADQPVLWVVDLAPLVLAGAGVIVGIQHARVDAALTATDQQVKERTRKLEAAKESLTELMASKDQFVAMVSHEVRNPLTAVMGFAEELRDGASLFTQIEVAELAGMMADQSMEISNIIEDMLVAARADMGSLTIVPGRTLLSEQVAMVVKACVCAALVRDTITVVAEPVVAWADEARVRQIVRNLLSNAVRYGGDAIEVVVSERNGVATICVCDDGVGVPAEQREQIFEAYQQVKGGTKVAGSVGLGLHVSRTLARTMGGELLYRYEGGRSVFELTLPLAELLTDIPAGGELASA